MKKLILMVAAVGAGASLLALAIIGSASAHAPYVSSTPAKGANLTTAPTSVVINFDAAIQRTAGSFGATVTKDGAGSVTSGAATVSADTQLTVPLQSGLTAGRYVVNWNNTAADDGDPLSGAFSFYINTQPTAAQQTQDQQLAAVEANQLATATAEAASAAPTTAAAAPTTAGGTAATPRAATSPAASSTLPKSGSGPSNGSSYSPWLLAAALGLVAMGGGALGLAYRRGRGR